MKRFAALMVITVLAAQPAAAQDARVRLVDYDPDKVTAIRAALGYQLMVEFAANERIENVSIGDAVGWQVTPNRRANILFLKPIDGQATNMTVVTDLRRYLFDLQLAPKGAKAAPAYALRFVYPTPIAAQPLPAREAQPQVANSAYSVTGAPAATPSRVFDDGEMTYFEWPPEAAAPAIFALAADGSESLVNYAVRGRYVVVQQLAPRFALRDGKQVAIVVNAGFSGHNPARSR
ncbi:TrbG/VirB9 family P-type conjugative transfer protein [Phenylobacterium sp. LjRoot219]|uniref:TrbG/VirB9 family P-type conjugative transfer protein n=1 Tax=Phenylobacterium sp. LjRoot219 TaxID=3342283 RepID=UPI003ED1342D